MKKQVLATILGIVIVLLLGTGFAFENKPEGFRELKWGDPPGEDMIYDRTDEYGLSLYKLPKEKENLKLGDTELWSVSYFFYGEPKRFARARLFFRDELKYLDLRTTCRARFGDETQERHYPRYCLWVGSLATVILEYRRQIKLGFLTLQSNAIMAKYTEVKRKKEVEKAEEDW